MQPRKKDHLVPLIMSLQRTAVYMANSMGTGELVKFEMHIFKFFFNASTVEKSYYIFIDISRFESHSIGHTH